MLASPNVRREWAFNLVMDERGTLLQGVIDCAFLEDDQWVLVDYKTDRITSDEQLADRYRSQLSFYKQALEQILGLPVTEAILYSFHLGREVAVNI